MSSVHKKKCTKCFKSKLQSEFYSTHSHCKMCIKKYKVIYGRSIGGWINRAYHRMKHNASLYNRAAPNFSMNEFKEFVHAQPQFLKLYKNWEKSNFEKWQKPSVDRINNNKSYTLKNIRLVTWHQNFKAASNPVYYRAVSRWLKSTLTKKNILAIKKARERGVMLKVLAKKYGLHKATISAIGIGKNWGDIK